jgi:hypothetical protein
MVVREDYEKFCDKLIGIRNDVFNSLRELVISMGEKVTIPFGIEDYVYNAIAYNGGNHPEYDSDCFARFESVYHDKDDDSVYVIFEDGYEQDLAENSIDDVLVVMDALLYVRDYNLKEEE